MKFQYKKGTHDEYIVNTLKTKVVLWTYKLKKKTHFPHSERLTQNVRKACA